MWQSKNFHTNNCRSCKKQSSDALTVYSLLICGLLFLISTGCAQERGLEAQSPRYVVEKTITEGPVSLDFKVSRDEITVVGKVELVLAAILPEGYEVEFPEPESGPKRLMVAHSHKTDPELTENSMVRIEKSYQLEPFLPGDYLIPQQEVLFRKKDEADSGYYRIRTEEVRVKVMSVLPEGEAGQEDIKDIAPPEELPRDPRMVYFVVIAAVVALLLAGGGALYWFCFRKRPEAPPPPPEPPHLTAYRALEELLAGNFLAEGRIKLFHIRVSDILRRYIENRFSLRAPEMTTEEFLVELGHTAAYSYRADMFATAPRASGDFRAEHKALLIDFLTHCDLVKFAKHEPTDSEIQATVNLCRQFIKETEPGQPEGTRNELNRGKYSA